MSEQMSDVKLVALYTGFKCIMHDVLKTHESELCRLPFYECLNLYIDKVSEHFARNHFEAWPEHVKRKMEGEMLKSRIICEELCGESMDNMGLE